MDTIEKTKGPATPVPAEVGKLYDKYTDLGADSLGDNLHFGYWEPAEVDIPFDEATDLLTDMMTDRLHLQPGDHLLDLGCGVGNPGTRTAVRRDVRVTGISVSGAQVQRANARAEHVGVADRVTFELRDAMAPGFAPATFDGVLALESIIHMPDRGEVLKMVASVLKPGGRLVLTDFFERSEIPEPGRTAVDRYLRDFMMTGTDLAEYPRLAKAAGLWVEEIRDISDFTLRRTFVELSSRIQADRAALGQAYGGDLVDAFDPGDLIDVPEFGYVLVVLRKPPSR